MPKDKPVKPFDSAKKPWKKMGSGDSSQVANLTEKVTKLEKKLKKTKKHGKKHARDSLDSDSDSD
jgi:ribosomal protein S15P/S13E